MGKIVSSTNWWSVDVCTNCNNEYGHHAVYDQINCNACGKISRNRILAPYYTVGKRKVWTVIYPWWMVWKWHKNESHFEYHGLRELKQSNIKEEQ